MIDQSKFIPFIREIKKKHGLDFKAASRKDQTRYGFMDRSIPDTWWVIAKEDPAGVMEVLSELAHGDRSTLNKLKDENKLIKMSWSELNG